MTDYDAIIIGAGHNGLAAGTVLAKRGLRVLTLEKNRALRAMLSFAAIQSTYKGPYTPGSAICLIHTLATNEDGGLMRRAKGGISSLSEALVRKSAADRSPRRGRSRPNRPGI